jgi:ribosome-associated protein
MTAELPHHVRRAAEAALEKKATDVVVLDVREHASFADYFLLASGTNQKQLVAIADEIREALRKQDRRPIHVEGYPRQEWVLMDYDSLVVHVMTEAKRGFYDLERLWGSARRIGVAP